MIPRSVAVQPINLTFGVIHLFKFSMGLWVLEDEYLDHVPGTVPLAEVSIDKDIEVPNGISCYHRVT
jgi:hypothetical protein